MRVVKPLAIGALVAFELGVFGMMLMPDVEPQYRAVYIDRTSDCWPLEVSGAVEPGRRISFVKTDAEGPSRHLLRCGWMSPEGTGTWSIGPESRLLLQVAGGRPATIDLELLPFAAQRVAVTVNGEPLTEWVLTKDSPRGQTLEVPPVPDGRLELAFHFPDAVAPRDLGLSNDRRRLAIRLLFLTLRPQ
jgi:hypothetical protein